MSTKWTRFFLPALPAITLLISNSIISINAKKPRTIALAITFIYSFFMISAFTNTYTTATRQSSLEAFSPINQSLLTFAKAHNKCNIEILNADQHNTIFLDYDEQVLIATLISQSIAHLNLFVDVSLDPTNTPRETADFVIIAFMDSYHEKDTALTSSYEKKMAHHLLSFNETLSRFRTDENWELATDTQVKHQNEIITIYLFHKTSPQTIMADLNTKARNTSN